MLKAILLNDYIADLTSCVTESVTLGPGQGIQKRRSNIRARVVHLPFLHKSFQHGYFYSWRQRPSSESLQLCFPCIDNGGSGTEVLRTLHSPEIWNLVG